MLVDASAALGSYFGYVIGSQTHALLGLVFAAAALGGEIVKPYAVSEVVSALSRFNLVRQPDIANGRYDIHWLEKFLAKP